MEFILAKLYQKDVLFTNIISSLPLSIRVVEKNLALLYEKSHIALDNYTCL